MRIQTVYIVLGPETVETQAIQIVRSSKAMTRTFYGVQSPETMPTRTFYGVQSPETAETQTV